MSKRFSITFTDTEYQKLQEMIDVYENEMGVRLSRCLLIKRLLFTEWKAFNNPHG